MAGCRLHAPGGVHFAPLLRRGRAPDPTTPNAEEELIARFDKKPWEFPRIAARVGEAVSSALKEPANAKDKETLDVVSDFVAAQRFFRAGFSGRLGRDFPVELLAGLHDVLTEGPIPAGPHAPLERPAGAARSSARSGDLGCPHQAQGG